MIILICNIFDISGVYSLLEGKRLLNLRRFDVRIVKVLFIICFFLNRFHKKRVLRPRVVIVFY